MMDDSSLAEIDFHNALWLKLCGIHEFIDHDCEMCMTGHWVDVNTYEIVLSSTTYDPTDFKGAAYWAGMVKVLSSGKVPDSFFVYSKNVKEHLAESVSEADNVSTEFRY